MDHGICNGFGNLHKKSNKVIFICNMYNNKTLALVVVHNCEIFGFFILLILFFFAKPCLPSTGVGNISGY